ncbi:MAG: dockerin type I domain-containing protein, partial [Pirellulaceae bacterium]|nr:dockerin type I domain-containing protein [Pirellulaceae bacterium]
TTPTGVTWFQQDVGTIAPLRNLATDADGTTQLGYSGPEPPPANLLMQVVTLLTQRYDDVVALLSHTRLDGSAPVAGGDAIIFAATVDSAAGGPFDLSIDTVRVPASDFGVTRFLGEVGGTGPVRDLTVETAGPFEVVANITTNQGPLLGDPLGDILIEIIDRPASLNDDFHLIQSANPVDPVVRVASVHGSISIVAGDDIVLDLRTAMEALAGQIDLRVDSGVPLDDVAVGGVIDIQGPGVTDGGGQANQVAAPTINLDGGADNDAFFLQYARFRAGDAIRVGGGGTQTLTHAVVGEGTTTRGAPTGGACGGSPATVEVSTIELRVGDRLTAIDSDSVIARDYLVTSAFVAQVGGPVFQYSDVQQVELIAGAGDDTLRVSAPMTGALGPVIVTFDGAAGNDHAIINGSAGDDQLIVGSAYSGTRHLQEIANTEFLWVRAAAGNDFVMNETIPPSVPSLLEGDGLGIPGRFDDTLIGGDATDLIFAGRGEDVLIGRGGNDFLYADTDFDGVGGGVLYLTEATDETLGDVLEGGAGTNSAAQVGALDRVGGINGTLLDGGACKDVITWLKAQIVSLGGGPAASAAAVNLLVSQGLAALGVSLRDPIGPAVIVPLSISLLRQRMDVNGDGELSPRDALLVINLLNTVGPGSTSEVQQRLRDASGGEGEGGGDDYFDVNADGYLSARDALLIINELNRPEAEGEAGSAGTLSASLEAAAGTQAYHPVRVATRTLLAGNTCWAAVNADVHAASAAAVFTQLGQHDAAALPQLQPYGPLRPSSSRWDDVAVIDARVVDDDLLDLLAAGALPGD